MKHKKQAFFFFFLLINLFSLENLKAQDAIRNFAENYWHDGKILTADNDTLYGRIKYDLANNVVQLELNKTIQTLTSRKALYFQIYDENNSQYRNYYALPYAVQNPNYEVPIFFELLSQGEPITLLCRERLNTEVVPINDIYTPTLNTVTRTTLDYEFYFLYVIQKGNEVSIKIKTFSKEAELLDLMSDWRTLVEKFIKENRLKVSQKYDVIDIVSYYNSLKAKNEKSKETAESEQ